ncbi:uncharacterized protein [Euwallacea fornicatus]|uniref:uncharacterized protein isoform X2 n=1 Tax=Euwallacea fornicatus TaxID=995702 RepID=UPI00338D4FCC
MTALSEWMFWLVEICYQPQLDMGVSVRQCLILVFSMTIFGVYGLKDIRVNIPLGVQVGETVVLQCTYDLEHEPLYTVKWYKGNNEFYRYIPKELPSTRVFVLPGIDVDLSKSSPHEVVLRSVQPEVTGRYKCEVSSDAPNFDTKMNWGYMHVLYAPVGDPVIYVEKKFADVDETIYANCSSPPSFPHSNISWYLDGIKVIPKVPQKVFPLPTDLFSKQRQAITTSEVEIKIRKDTFKNGKANLSCVATVFGIYRGEKTELLGEATSQPMSSSVLGPRDETSDAKRQIAPKIGHAVVLLLMQLCR